MSEVLPRLTNRDVVFLMRMVSAHIQGMHLIPGKQDSKERFAIYQYELLEKLRALDLDDTYSKDRS